MRTSTTVHPGPLDEIACDVWQFNGQVFGKIGFDSVLVMAADHPDCINVDELADRLETAAAHLRSALARLRVEQQHDPLWSDNEVSVKVCEQLAQFQESLR